MDRQRLLRLRPSIKIMFRNGEKAGEADCQREETESRREGARWPVWRPEGGTRAGAAVGPDRSAPERGSRGKLGALLSEDLLNSGLSGRKKKKKKPFEKVAFTGLSEFSDTKLRR